MGLGKTIQLLALLLAERDHRRPASGTSRGRRPGPTLLICPVSVVGNWEREAQKLAPSLSVHVHHGRQRLTGHAFAKVARASDLVVTTYALALRDRAALAAVKWYRLVLDEAQNIKSIDTKQTRAIRTLTARHRIALTGTPVKNRLSELHSIMDFLTPACSARHPASASASRRRSSGTVTASPPSGCGMRRPVHPAARPSRPSKASRPRRPPRLSGRQGQSSPIYGSARSRARPPMLCCVASDPLLSTPGDATSSTC